MSPRRARFIAGTIVPADERPAAPSPFVVALWLTGVLLVLTVAAMWSAVQYPVRRAASRPRSRRGAHAAGRS